MFNLAKTKINQREGWKHESSTKIYIMKTLKTREVFDLNFQTYLLICRLPCTKKLSELVYHRALHTLRIFLFPRPLGQVLCHSLYFCLFRPTPLRHAEPLKQENIWFSRLVRHNRTWKSYPKLITFASLLRRRLQYMKFNWTSSPHLMQPWSYFEIQFCLSRFVEALNSRPKLRKQPRDMTKWAECDRRNNVARKYLTARGQWIT